MSTIKADTLSTLDGTKSVTTDRVTQGTAAAWVNFNGQGTVAIRASYNVSSITDNGTGDYTVNFTTAMPDVNYAAVFGGRIDTGNADANLPVIGQRRVASATSSIRVVSLISTNTAPQAIDMNTVSVAIFR
jgi:hypothetical protein